MKKDFELLTITRKNIFKAIQNLSDEQLIKIPAGFNNNILWNVGHVISSSQKLTYGMAGLPMRIGDGYSPYFGKGTTPKEWTSTPDIKKIKEDLLSTAALLEEDYKNGIFKTYKEYETSYGFFIRSIEEAIFFDNVHEGLHLGYIMALKKSI